MRAGVGNSLSLPEITVFDDAVTDKIRIRRPRNMEMPGIINMPVRQDLQVYRFKSR